MHDVEVLEGREGAVKQRAVDEELDLATGGAQPVAGVNTKLFVDALYHPADLALEVQRVVDYVEVKVADPRRGYLVVELARQAQALRATCVILGRVEFLGAVGCRDHVDDLVVTVVA